LQTDAWGIKVSNVELKHVDLNETMVRAIAKQAEAERLRRAKVIDAEGERTYHECVKMYRREDFLRFCELAGFEPVKWWGDYNGAEFTEESERLILWARCSTSPARRARRSCFPCPWTWRKSSAAQARCMLVDCIATHARVRTLQHACRYLSHVDAAPDGHPLCQRSQTTGQTALWKGQLSWPSSAICPSTRPASSVPRSQTRPGVDAPAVPRPLGDREQHVPGPRRYVRDGAYWTRSGSALQASAIHPPRCARK